SDAKNDARPARFEYIRGEHHHFEQIAIAHHHDQSHTRSTVVRRILKAPHCAVRYLALGVLRLLVIPVLRKRRAAQQPQRQTYHRCSCHWDSTLIDLYTESIPTHCW